jgi:hypothetical protein
MIPMKKYVYLISIILMQANIFLLNAQPPAKEKVGKGHTVKTIETNAELQETVMIMNKHAEVIQYTGKSYSYKDLYRLARRDVNGIAGITAGVDHIPGSASVRIRGADPSGTAYFVDGVRSYGTLPMSFR